MKASQKRGIFQKGSTLHYIIKKKSNALVFDFLSREKKYLTILSGKKSGEREKFGR